LSRLSNSAMTDSRQTKSANFMTDALSVNRMAGPRALTMLRRAAVAVGDDVCWWRAGSRPWPPALMTISFEPRAVRDYHLPRLG
jgi:hypothetical protein